MLQIVTARGCEAGILPLTRQQQGSDAASRPTAVPGRRQPRGTETQWRKLQRNWQDRGAALLLFCVIA